MKTLRSSAQRTSFQHHDKKFRLVLYCLLSGNKYVDMLKDAL